MHKLQQGQFHESRCDMTVTCDGQAAPKMEGYQQLLESQKVKDYFEQHPQAVVSEDKNYPHREGSTYTLAAQVGWLSFRCEHDESTWDDGW